MSGKRPTVVWVSHFVPYPPIGGCFQRSYHLIRRLSRSHDLHLVAVRHKASVHQNVTLESAREALEQVCASVDIVDLSDRSAPHRLLAGAAVSVLRSEPMTATLYQSEPLSRAIHRTVVRYRPDVLHLDTIGLARYASLAGTAQTVLGHHNAEASMMARRVAFERNPAAKAFYRLEAYKLGRYERDWCRRFDANVVVSRHDGETLRASSALDSYDVVPNGVDIDGLVPVARDSSSNELIFAGRLDQYANRDGIVHFVRTAWPLIRGRRPDATLVILGANPPADVLALASEADGIRVTGFVDDIRPYFARAAATVIPLRDGGGTRLKVLDALALGMPIVSTSLGIEGLDLEPEQDVLIADTPQAFASQVERVLEDVDLRQRLALRARSVAVDRFGWDRIAEDLSGVYLRLVNGVAAAGPAQGAVLSDATAR